MDNMETNKLNAYCKPELVEYGSVTALIRSGGPSMSADNGGQSSKTITTSQQTAG